MEDSIKRIDDFAASHNQKQQGSQLYGEVLSVLKCSSVKAREVSAKLCNVLSTYMLLYGPGYIEMSFPDFFRYLIDEGDVDKNTGWMTVRKVDLFRKLGHDISIVEYKTIDGLPEGLYQIKISNQYGTHFMAGYVIDGILYLADTSWRGVHVKASDKLKGDTVEWVNQIVHA